MILNKKIKIEEFILIIFPVCIIAGPLIAEFAATLLSIMFLIFCFRNKNFFFFNHWIVKLILIFYFIINFSGLHAFIFSSYKFELILKNFFYFRFITLSGAIYWIISKNDKMKEYFFFSLLFCFILLFAGAIYEFFFKINCGQFSQSNVYEFKQSFFLCNKKYLIGNLIRADRLSSFFGSELILGSYLSRLFPLLLYLFFLIVKNKYKNFFLVILFISTFIVCFFSGERTSFFYICLTAFIFFIFYKIDLKKKLVLFLGPILLIIIISITLPDIKNRMINQTINQIYDKKNQKIIFFSKEHQSHIMAALEMLDENIFFGIGPKNFYNICSQKGYELNFKFNSKNFSYDEYSPCSTHPHNTYVQILTETGIVGLIIPVILLISILKFYISNFAYLISKKKNILITKIILVTCFLISLFPLIPSGSFFTNHLNIIFYLPLGFLIHELNNDGKNDHI